jgi:hypothetical protein
MNWQAICDDPTLKDLPFKLETDRWGKIVMSPATNRHSRYQGLITRLLDRILTDGEAIPECSIQTTDGVKVADVAVGQRRFSAVGIAYHQSLSRSAGNRGRNSLTVQHAGGDGGKERTLLCPWRTGVLDMRRNAVRCAFTATMPGLRSSGLARSFPARVELPFS